MIRSFRNSETERVWIRKHVRRWSPELQRAARRKLVQLNSATTLTDLRVPPGNRLEALTGSRMGQHSIRINDQWRVCFIWADAGPEQAEIVDYH
ncbi:MAG: type II toxin-antitoxin system RelE/ParE family toxin [Actinomycetes bacterium]